MKLDTRPPIAPAQFKAPSTVSKKAVAIGAIVALGLAVVVVLKVQSMRLEAEERAVYAEQAQREAALKKSLRDINIKSANDLAAMSLKMAEIEYNLNGKTPRDRIAAETLYATRKLEIEQQRQASIAKANSP